MYAKCGCLEDAVAVFDLIQPKNNHSWNILMAAFALNGHPREALDIFHRVGAAMDGDAGKIAIVNALGALHSRSPEELEAGREIHGRIVAKELQGDGVVATALLSMYGRCGEGIDDAWSVFDAIQRHPDQDHRSVVPWNAMLAALAQRGYGGDVVALFRRMDVEGVEPNAITLATLAEAVSDVALAAQLQARMTATGLDASFDPAVGNALIAMYGRCGAPDQAREVFDQMPLRSRSVITWTAVISAYAARQDRRHAAAALRLLWQMDHEGLIRPNETTMARIAAAGCVLGDPTQAALIHARIEAMLGERLGGGASSGAAGGDHLILATTIVNMFSRCGRLEDARGAFERIQHKDSIAWNSMIAAEHSHGCHARAVALLRRMDLEGVKPSEGTFASIVAAIASTGSADQLGFARSFHARIVDASFQVGTSPVGNALIHMYGKCGSAEDAQAVFDAMEIRSVNCWTALIEAYAQLGRGSQALQWFQAMRREGICPDPIAFVGILFACSHSGLLRDARYYFLSMIEDHGMQPIAEHYECMVDLLGRTGQLQRAQELIEIMPFYPKPLAWMSLLGASSVQSSDEHAGDAAEHLCF
ncbi:pentatricopeptide repeat-containing protein At3g46790, chloroplastic-like [Selaginella moellendorffii]|uniref:pentatricopeptide repeat-containing protein At3g46790, chloroplastic-like n=1 Tax=Selaginella moellendorffii TaxID=88036 RepID=UPI000D1CA2BD|nr:pentatricopeptide repeat-containing protein At3g46790, chloroplastic-like [Selaginella moellendorffii]|eukprot:XP_024536289.1 pentatricopeptide repeat-containing protein At3g46790, chloroplastic-like [Selaginella moellendorffii]